MKRSYKVLSLLLTLALVFGLLPTVLPTVVEAAAKDTPAGVRNHLPSTAKDVVYLSDMTWEYSINYALPTNPEPEAIKDGAWSSGGKIVMGLAENNGGTVFTKGLGVMPIGTNSNPDNASRTIFDLADNNYKQNYFYAAAGITNGTAQAGGTTNGLVFEVWGSYDKTQEDYTKAEYKLLERSGDTAKGTHVKGSYVYQFHLDVTDVRYLKLVVYAVGGVGYMNCNWAGVCVYNNEGYYPKSDLMGLNNGKDNTTWVPSGTDRFNTYHFNSIPSNAVLLSGSTYKNTSDNKGTSKVVDFKSASGNLGNTARWLGGVADRLDTTVTPNLKDGLVLKDYTKFLCFNARQPASSNNQADGWITFDISDLTVNRFYAAIGGVNNTGKHTAYIPSEGKYGGMKVQVWGAETKDGAYTLLSESEPFVLSNVGEFDVDITGVKFLKLRVQAKDTRKIDGLDVLFYNPCVFYDEWTAAVSGEDSVLQGMKADYTATVTREFAPLHNTAGTTTWTVTGANGAGTKIENGKLVVDPYETATELQVTASVKEGNRTVTATPKTVTVVSTGDNVAYVGDNGFGTLTGAVAADGNEITLVKDIALTEAVAVDKTVTLDLNGKTVSGATIATLGAGADLTIVADGGELEGELALSADGATITSDCAIDLEMNGNDATVNAKNVTLTDAATDNGDVGGKVYGNITLANAVTKEGNISYVAIPGEDANGKYYTANAVRVAVTKVNIRPSAAGMYFTTAFKFNKNVVDAGATYGVVLSLQAKPGADFMAGAKGEAWTVGAAPTAGENFVSTGNSCLVKDIFKDTTPEENAARGETKIYANAYVKIGDAVVMAENTTDVVYSMQTVMQALNEKFGQLDSGTSEKVVNFYKDWTTAMATWSVANIAEAAK